MILITKLLSGLSQNSTGCMKKMLFLCSSLILVISCNQLSPEEKLIMDSLNRKVDFGKLEIVHTLDDTMALESIRIRYKYIYLVSLQIGCRSCYQEYVLWQNEMNSYSSADNFTILFNIQGDNYDDFKSELMIYESDFNLSTESFYIVMDPEQKFINANPEINPGILANSIMIDEMNKIILVGKPFASEQMKGLFENIILE